ncbi:MAG: serine hydrolase, partial [Oscillospiraceae bacterium]|nr:serine hydrolase [Oscillospiraceae bacterium]
MKKFLCVAAALGLLIAMSVPVWAQENEDMPATPEWDTVISEFFEENGINPETVTFGYYNTVTGEEHYHRGDVELTAGSITKVPLNMYFAEKIYNGEMDWDTTIKGISYEIIQMQTIRFSNNEYTYYLIEAAGEYPNFRRAICPYIGVDPDSREFAFFTV